jgi:two-component system, LytTR family, sensor histidine kinase AgrC
MTETLGVFLIAYFSYFCAFLLVGQDKKTSFYVATVPAILALVAFLSLWKMANYVAAGLCGISGFCSTLYLTKRNVVISTVASLLSISFCLLGQLLLTTFQLNDWQSLMVGLGYLFITGMVLLLKITIFPEKYILTKEQKKGTVYSQFYFFPALVFLIAWQIFLLTAQKSLKPQAVGLLIFTVLLQLVVLLLLRQQVQSLQERIENIIDKQYQAELLSFMQVIRSQRHDFNFHTQTIWGMIESGHYEECKAYVQSMLQTVKSTNDILPLYHPATSALLNTFREMALQKGLKMDIEIHDNLQFICTTVYETNTILGNLIQNSIDELELHPENKDRTIHVLIMKRGRNNILKISNQCHLSPEEMNRIFLPGFTTKKTHEGLGLANALRIAEEYDGTVYPEFEGQTVHFIAKLPMK